jgi:hypothetical protein
MRLSEFIQDTLYEIAVGVQLAQAKAKDLVAISPSRIDGQLVEEKCYVDFDVSIIVTDTTGGNVTGSGKITGEIRVASIAKISGEVGGSGKKVHENTTAQTHRVLFKVPVYMHANFKNNPETAVAAAMLLKQKLDNKI